DEGEATHLALAVRSASKNQKTKHILEEVVKFLAEKGIHLTGKIQDNQEIIECNLEEAVVDLSILDTEISALGNTIYKPFSLYPYMVRDVAVWVSKPKSKDDVEQIIA